MGQILRDQEFYRIQFLSQECFLSSDDAVSLPTGLHTDRDFTFSERSGCNSGNDVSKLRPSSYLYEFWPGGGNTGDGLRGEDGGERINKTF